MLFEVVSNSPVEQTVPWLCPWNQPRNAVDSLYQYGQTGFSHPTDITVTNGGGLRETISIKANQLQKETQYQVFETQSHKLATGQQVLDIAENYLIHFAGG